MTLTEQWKKGELEWGKNYYCRNVKTNETNICFLYGSTWYSADSDGEGDIDWQGYLEVLAPVPSYEEWQKVLNIDFNNEVLRLENAKLKELLKECRERLGDYAEFCIKGGYLNAEDEAVKMITKIDNAIGEK